ncbi:MULTISPECIES: hypothetical protein [Symbiopectobacterium]|uniref:hypothetical protein n=1 Tax=Symbiopectobacterium TaxID=801 RepID=UPI001A3107B0|nr:MULTISPECIES: hypothetical protein [Symbiopectobacterium]MBG6247689.1 hypothetical protein [Candidatus Symbiopectobacterium sp. PLON1]MBT9428958.1 hypothetical protein [Candidatus Symbiopectobacterium endolongispinus]
MDNANEFSATRSVEISLKDAFGAVLARQTAASLTGPQIATITPTANFWGKAATLSVVAQGYGSLKTESTQNVTISSAGIAHVKDFASGVAQVGTTYSDGTYASYCRTIWLGSNTDWRGAGDIYLKVGEFGNKTLISPMSIVVFTGIDGFNERKETVRLSNASVSVALTRVGLIQGPILRGSCWANHESYFTASYEIIFRGVSKRFSIVNSSWLGGNSASNAHGYFYFNRN